MFSSFGFQQLKYIYTEGSLTMRIQQYRVETNPPKNVSMPKKALFSLCKILYFFHLFYILISYFTFISLHLFKRTVLFVMN